MRAAIESTTAHNTELLVQNTSRNIPPCNLAAETPDKVYPLDQLMPRNVWHDLDEKELLEGAKKSSLVADWKESKRCVCLCVCVSVCACVSVCVVVMVL